MEQAGLYFAGEAGLANGFRLAGFEVLPDIGIDGLEQLLLRLKEEREPAFVVLDYHLAGIDSRIVREIREEGGRILIAQVPSLSSDEPLRSCVDPHLGQLLGGADL